MNVNDHMSVDLFDVDNLTDMIDHAVTALRVTDVQRGAPRDYPATRTDPAFTAQTVYGTVGHVTVHITAFTYPKAAT